MVLAIISGLRSNQPTMLVSTQSGKPSTGRIEAIVGRFIAFLGLLAFVILLLHGINKAVRYLTTRRRQKLAAEFAPEMLRYEDLPGNVVEAYIEQREQLDAANTIFTKMIEDQFFDLTTQYHTLITSWLKGQQKEITK